MFIRFDRIHERDGHTDTARRHRPRLCIASRGNKSRTDWSASTSTKNNKSCCRSILLKSFQQILLTEGLLKCKNRRNRHLLESLASKYFLPFREWWPCHPRPLLDSSWTMDLQTERSKQNCTIMSASKVRYRPKLLNISIIIFSSACTQTWYRSECGVCTISSAARVQNNAAPGSGAEPQHRQLPVAPPYAECSSRPV